MKKYVFCVGLFLCSIPLFSQDIGLNTFFNKNDYSVRIMAKQIYFPGGTMSRFDFGDWEYRRIWRSGSTSTYFADVDVDDTISSNAINLVMSNDNFGSYSLSGGEVLLKEKQPISFIGYEVGVTRTELFSPYYVVLYLSKTDNVVKKNQYKDTALWRMVLFFNDQYMLEGEMVSPDKNLFIRSTYEFVNSARQIKNSPIPSIFTLERIDQTIIAVVNTLRQRVLWQSDDLSERDQVAVAMFAGAVNNLRFDIGKNGILDNRRNVSIKKQKRAEKKSVLGDFTIEEDFILYPDELSE